MPQPKFPKYDAHPLAELFPMMADPAIDELAEDIDANGLLDKIWLYEGKILDGRNRYEACRRKDVDPKFEEYKGKDAMAFVISKNLPRRHLSESQRAMVAANIATARRGGQAKPGEGTNSSIPATSTKEAAKKLNVSPSSVKAAKKVKKKGAAELVQAVESGKVTVAAAAKVAELPKEEQKKVVAAGPKAVKDAAAQARNDPPVKQTRPMPHQTRAGKGGLGGEKFNFAATVEKSYGALIRSIEQMAAHFDAKNGRSHNTALEKCDELMSYLKTWHNRAVKKEAE